MTQQTDDKVIEDLVVAAPAVEAEDNSPAVETIQIGEQTFTSNDEAIAYAKQLQSKVATHDAYQQGINDALANQPQVQNVTSEPVVEQPLFDEARFYEDPQGVLRELNEKAVNTAVEMVRKESAQKEQANKMWSDFYSKYPKLQKSDKMVKRLLEDNWAVLGAMPDGKKAMDILAQKATAEIQSMLSDYMPGQELPTNRQATTPGGQINVTPPTTEEPVLDFIAQSKQHFKL